MLINLHIIYGYFWAPAVDWVAVTEPFWPEKPKIFTVHSGLDSPYARMEIRSFKTNCIVLKEGRRKYELNHAE